MNQTKPLPAEFLLHISQLLNVQLNSLTATISLLDEGGTVPFIARYRKEVTRALDEVKIRDIEEQLAYFRELISRRETILASISEQQKLTDELRHKIEATMDKGELEDLYLPYRPKRRTKATIERERGLEPLADYLWSQQKAERSLLEFAATFIDEAKQITTISEALEGARHIVAERIAETAEVRKALRQLLHDEGVIMSRKMMDAVDAQEKFKMYYEYREPVKTIPSHRMLAIRRGEAESILYFLIEVDPLRATGIVRRHILGAEGDWTPQLIIAIEDSWNRLLSSSIQSEVRLELKKRSDLDAIQVFRDNLNNLLLAPPAGPISVLGVDPGQRTGCKIAVVDETGKFLAHDVIYLHTGQTTKANQTLAHLIRQHQVRAIAIGNGTASRDGCLRPGLPRGA
jgi:protein Tex